MSQYRLPKLSLSELLVRHKYQNVHHLITSRNTYYNSRNGTFDFQGDILENSTATMAFRVLQFQANWWFIEELCTSYVYGLENNEFNERQSKIRLHIRAIENDILQNYYLVESFMGTPVEKNVARYVSALKSSMGYQTIGDQERDLALYLSPFCSYQQFSHCVDAIEERLKMASSIHEPWIGLFNHLRTGAMTYHKELEDFTKEKLVVD